MLKIILASSSPRRKELLEKAGLTFTVVESAYEEDLTLNMKPKKLVEHLAKQKALCVYENHPHAIVIGSDTVVVIRGKVLGKAHTKSEARTMLTLLNGKTHFVMTGLAVIYKDTILVCSSVSKVTFKNLAKNEIEAYIQTKEPLEKAGAYAIQGKGALLIENINGDYNGIVGLPVSLLKEKFIELLGTDALKLFYTPHV